LTIFGSSLVISARQKFHSGRLWLIVASAHCSTSVEKTVLNFSKWLEAASKPKSNPLLDIMMPEMDGFEVCQRLKSQEKTRDIPIIFLTALVDSLDKAKGFELGAVDYITKPFQGEQVIACVNAHLSNRQECDG